MFPRCAMMMIDDNAVRKWWKCQIKVKKSNARSLAVKEKETRNA
jgi:hypothetical protein